MLQYYECYLPMNLGFSFQLLRLRHPNPMPHGIVICTSDIDIFLGDFRHTAGYSQVFLEPFENLDDMFVVLSGTILYFLASLSCRPATLISTHS